MKRKEFLPLVNSTLISAKIVWNRTRRVYPSTCGLSQWYTHLRVAAANLLDVNPTLLEDDELNTYTSKLHAFGCVLHTTDNILHSGASRKDLDDLADACEDLYMSMPL